MNTRPTIVDEPGPELAFRAAVRPDGPAVPELVENWYRVEAAAKDESGRTRAALHVVDAIGGWFGLDVATVIREIDALEVDDLDVFINSPGGDAFGGLAIGNALRRNKARVTVHVDGLAASAASVVAMGGDEVVMGHGAQLMIHDASAICWGDAADMTKTAEMLDKLSNSYAAVYALRGGTADHWRAAMRAESWYTAQEAVDAGLADRALGADEGAPAADVEAAWDLSMYRHPGRSHSPSPAIPARASAAARSPLWSSDPKVSEIAFAGSVVDVSVDTPSPPPAGASTKRKDPVMGFIEDVREALGVSADADEPTVLAALTDRLSTKAAAPEGLTLVDTDILDQLQADAAAGRAARDEQIAAARVALVEAAVRDGRVSPARRDHWLAQIEADPALADTLAALPPLFNTEEKGITGGPEQSGDTGDSLFAMAWGSPAPAADTKEA